MKRAGLTVGGGGVLLRRASDGEPVGGNDEVDAVAAARDLAAVTAPAQRLGVGTSVDLVVCREAMRGRGTLNIGSPVKAILTFPQKQDPCGMAAVS